jgi:hypothetical protein
VSFYDRTQDSEKIKFEH